MNDVKVDAKAIFLQALDCPDAAERRGVLEESCGSNALLRARVEELLKAHEAAGAFLGGLQDDTVDMPVAERAGTLIGPYKLMEQIGEGGMGLVFVAEQQHPVRRKVAIKVIKPGLDTRHVVARFEAERQALALMDHPNIASVFDAGATESGRPYFVMELVRGVGITQFCDENRLTTRERLELFINVCQAVQHAHHKGIIHRDLKASNILVTLHDGRPVVKVIDFGVAKAIGQQLTDKTIYTRFAQIIGTPMYMSPEQAEMSGLDIDTRSDIYALGVLLYELLTGTTPFDAERIRTAPFDEMRRILREEEPPKPSTRLSTLGQAATAVCVNRQTVPNRLSQLFRGELDWIVMKALEKDRTRRYETASAFAADVQRYLADEPVLACPASRVYRLRKFAWKNRPLLAVLSGFFALFAAGFGVSTWQAVRAVEAERLAEENERKALAQQAIAQTRFALAKDAVDAYLNRVTDHPKLNEKDFVRLRKELLETALPFYRTFVEQQEGDPKLEALRGQAYARLAKVCVLLGEKEEARSNMEAGQAIFAKLVADFPDVPMYREELGKSCRNLGVVLVSQRLPREAEAAYRSALEIHGRLVSEIPGEPGYRRNLAKVHDALGLLLKDLGRPIKAEETFRTALKIQEQLKPELLSVPEFRLELAHSHNNLAILLKGLGRHEESTAAHAAARKEYEQLVVDFPNVAEYRNCLATSLYNLGNLLSDQGKSAEAEEAYRAALKFQERLVADFPSVPEHRQDQARSHNNLQLLLAKLGQDENAEAACRDALKILEQLVADFPCDADYAIDLATSFRSLGLLDRKQGKLPAAQEWFSQAIRLLEPIVKKDPGMSKTRRCLRNTYWSRAATFNMQHRYGEAVLDWDRAILLSESSEVPAFQERRTRSLFLNALTQDFVWPLIWCWPR